VSIKIILVVTMVAAMGLISGQMVAECYGESGSTGSPSGDGGTPAAETGGTVPDTESAGLSLIESAAAAGKYTFIFFYADESEQTQGTRVVFYEAMSKIVEESVSLEIDTTDPEELPLVNRFGVSRAPMPLILAVAPNGAITGAFRQGFEESKLLGAFVSPGEEKSLKALQASRVVLVCVQNGDTELNDAAMKGVQDIKADPKFGPSTEIVTLDPVDPAEAGFLKALQVAPQTKEAVTVCVAPPGRVVARFTGATKKETIVAALSSGGGCSSKGCSPKGCGK